MGERLRSRDVRNNSNKCYTVFFDEGDDELKNAFTKSAKMKNSRSPPKKRESPKKRTKKTTIMTVTDPLEDGVGVLSSASELAVGGDLANHATGTSTNFVASDTTEVVSLSGKQEYDEVEEGAMVKVMEKVGEEKLYEGSIRVMQPDQEEEKTDVGVVDVEENKIEHVVACGDEDDLKSESLQSNKNNKRKFSASLEFNSLQNGGSTGELDAKDDENVKKIKLSSMKEQMFEIFQPWALETYGDQAKTKTITQRKKNRILKALDGKEHSNPDSSKFRFWVKSKGNARSNNWALRLATGFLSIGFTVHRPENFSDSFIMGAKIFQTNGATVAISTNATTTKAGGHEQNTMAVQRMDTQKDHIDLYVASTTKDFGERVYRKVAVVEEFFDIIYSIHVDFGGRSGRHAGQKRTYRIITETYAFLPREAVTKFLSNCPTCKKNLRPFSPSRFEDTFTESSSEFEALNYSSPNESSVDSTQAGLIKSVRRKAEGKASPLVISSYNENFEMTAIGTKCDREIKDREFSSYYLDKVTTHVDKKANLSDRVELHDGDYVKVADSAGKDVELIGSSTEFKYDVKTDLDHETDVASWNFDGGVNMSTPNCYQYFKRQLTPINKNSKHKLDSKHGMKNRINLNTATNENSSESCIDLTINEPSNINISIGNNLEMSKTTLLPHTQSFQTLPVREEYFNSVDVSINMSKASNELKISCKTTPPKKRYSIYRDKDNDHYLEPHSSTTFAKSQNMRVGGEMKAGTSTGYCAMNLCKKFSNESSEGRARSSTAVPTIASSVPALSTEPLRVDLSKVKPITSTYLRMTRSFGLSDEDALRIDDLESVTPSTADAIMPETNPEEAYAGLMKDADKLKLMLLAWNYQNSNAIRNGSEAPDLGVVGGLWAQYQNALALNAKQPSVSPINRTDQPSPIENQDETNSSGQKDEDDGSEDDSDDKLDQNAHDPERLKAFNMFVRLFVDENLDRMIPISKQPKEKIQAIIDSCARQFPEFCERSRKRIRTYLKSCRRNKKTREGWDTTSRPTPAHLTSVQAEQILAIACENESMNAKRMRIGLDPISQSLPLTTNNTITTDVVAPSITYPGFRATPNTTTVSTTEMDTAQPSTTSQSIQSSARSSPISLTTTNPPVSVDVKISNPPMNGVVTSQVASPLYRPAEFTSPSSTSSPYSVSAASRPSTTYPAFFPVASSVNVTPTDLSMKQHVQSTTQQSTQQLPTLATTNASSSVAATGRPPLLSHKLNPNEISAVRQLITGYRESAAFLLRSADELEQLLLQQQ